MIHRKLFLLAIAATLVASVGCSKPKPPATTPPPALVTTPSAPSSDVNSRPTPAPAVDETEKPVEKSLQELQKEFETQGLLGDVYFDYDKAELRDDAKARLARNAEFLRTRAEFSFTIEGHCDERGTNEYNIALGQRRAAAAVDYIVSLGVPATRFKTISYGEERPFCTESNEGCWQKNRRARFLITGRN